THRPRPDALHRVQAPAIELSPPLASPARCAPECDHLPKSKAARGLERVDSRRDRTLDRVPRPDPTDVLPAGSAQSSARRTSAKLTTSYCADTDRRRQGQSL